MAQLFCSRQSYPLWTPTFPRKGLPPKQLIWVLLGPCMRLADTRHPSASQS